MEWFQSTLTAAIGLLAGIAGTVLTLYFWARGKLSATRRQETINATEAEEAEFSLKDKEIRRTEERYEDRIKSQEARHMRELDSQADAFHVRLKEVDDLLKEHSAALKAVHAENLECQRRDAATAMKNEVLEMRVTGLKVQNDEQAREISGLKDDLRIMRSVMKCPASDRIPCPVIVELDKKSTA